jgi:4-hydroxybenzoate polyprenyltransferase
MMNHKNEGFMMILGENINLFFLILSTMLIAAAGNIINDYFDVKADRINKPKRLIIDKYIKRRWAMVMHWSFNGIGFTIALYLGYVLQNIWVPLISFMSINMLWFYSVYFKRKALYGNLMVSLLLGIVPFYVFVMNTTLGLNEDSIDFVLAVITGVSCIAFFMNLIRELVKDIQDIRGDIRLGAKTFPIKFGIKKTKWLIAIMAILTLVAIAIYFYFIVVFKVIQSFFETTNVSGPHGYVVLIFSAVLMFLTAVLITLFAKKIKTYKLASTLLKVAMLFGLLTPLFL